MKVSLPVRNAVNRTLKKKRVYSKLDPRESIKLQRLLSALGKSAKVVYNHIVDAASQLTFQKQTIQ